MLEATTDHQLSTDAACSQLTVRRRLFPQDEEGKSEAASTEEVGPGRWGSPLRPSPRPCLFLTLRKSCIVSEERKPRPWDSYELLGSLVRGDGTCPARDPKKQGEATNRVTLPLTCLCPKMVSNGLGVEYPLQAHAFAPLSQLVVLSREAVETLGLGVWWAELGPLGAEDSRLAWLLAGCSLSASMV